MIIDVTAVEQHTENQQHSEVFRLAGNFQPGILTRWMTRILSITAGVATLVAGFMFSLSMLSIGALMIPVVALWAWLVKRDINKVERHENTAD